jgi:hypothetical protein
MNIVLETLSNEMTETFVRNGWKLNPEVALSVRNQEQKRPVVSDEKMEAISFILVTGMCQKLNQGCWWWWSSWCCGLCVHLWSYEAVQ